MEKENNKEICVGDIIEVKDNIKNIVYKTTVSESTPNTLSWYYKENDLVSTINIKFNKKEDLQNLKDYTIKLLFKSALVVDTIVKEKDKYINLDENTCKCLYHKWQSLGDLYAVAYLEGSYTDSQSTVRHLKRYGVQIDSIENDSLGAFLSCVEYDVGGSWGILNELYNKIGIDKEYRVKYTTQEEFDKEQDKICIHNKSKNGRKIIHSYDNITTSESKK